MNIPDADIERFRRITRSDRPSAQLYLKENDGKLKGALADFYSMEHVTFIDSKELKAAKIQFVPPPQTAFPDQHCAVPGLLIDELVAVLGSKVKSSLPMPFSDILTSKRRLLVFMWALTREPNVFKVAKKFSIPPKIVMAIVLHVSAVVNATFDFPEITERSLREDAERFHELTGFPGVAATLGALAWEFTIIIAADLRIIGYKLKTPDKTGECYADLLPDLSYRFLTTESVWPSDCMHTPYYVHWDAQPTDQEKVYNDYLSKIQQSRVKVIENIKTIFHYDFDTFCGSKWNDLRLCCVHLYNFMRRDPKLMPVVEKSIKFSHWNSICCHSDKNKTRDAIAQYLLQKSRRK